MLALRSSAVSHLSQPRAPASRASRTPFESAMLHACPRKHCHLCGLGQYSLSFLNCKAGSLLSLHEEHMQGQRRPATLLTSEVFEAVAEVAACCRSVIAEQKS